MATFSYLNRGRCRMFSDTINWAIYGGIKDMDFILTAGFNVYYGDLDGSGEETFPRHMAHRSIEYQREHLEVNRPHIETIRNAGIAYIYYASTCTFDGTFFDAETTAAFACEFKNDEVAFRTPNRKYACYNSPQWLQFLVDKSAMLVNALQFDGIFFDNTFYLNPCRCKHCVDKFSADTGLDLLEVQDKITLQDTDEAVHNKGRVFLGGGGESLEAYRMYQIYANFRLKCVSDFNRAFRRQLDARISKPFAIINNTFINMPEGMEMYRADLFECYYTENGYTYPPETNAFSYKVGNAIYPDKRHSVVVITRPLEGMPTPAMFKVALGEAMANGGCSTPWGFFVKESDNAKQAVRQYVQFQKRHEELLARQTNLADAAVVMPLEASMLKKLMGDEQQYMNNGAHVACRMLADCKIPHDILFEKDVWDVKALIRYRLVVLPEVDILSDHNFEVLRQMAAGGTKIVLTADSLRWDERLVPRKDRLEGENVLYLEQPFPRDYCSARLFEEYEVINSFKHVQHLRRLYRHGMLQVAAAPLTHVTITHSDTEVLCHFVNYNVNRGPYSIRGVPDYNIETVLAPGRSISEAIIYSPDNEGSPERLPVKTEDESVRFTLPRLDYYAFVLLR